jgi:hypothetical protein
MPGRLHGNTSLAAAPECTAPASLVPALTDTQIDHWAELIAEGRDRFPVTIAPLDCERLIAAVRQRLRDRLIQHIARVVASDLQRLSELSREGKC